MLIKKIHLLQDTLSKTFWGIVWNIAESFNLPFGKYAPWVFGKAIGCKNRDLMCY